MHLIFKAFLLITFCCLFFTHCNTREAPPGHITFGRGHFYKLEKNETHQKNKGAYIDTLIPFVPDSRVQFAVNKAITTESDSILTLITIVLSGDLKDIKKIHSNYNPVKARGQVNNMPWYLLNHHNLWLFRTFYKCPEDKHLYAFNYFGKDSTHIASLQDSTQFLKQRITCN